MKKKWLKSNKNMRMKYIKRTKYYRVKKMKHKQKMFY